MKLYTFEIAPNPRRVALLLKHKGIELETQAIDLGKGEHFADSYKAINPDCTVPALVLDDGTVLKEVVAICLYLDSLYPEKTLFGRSDLERAQVVGWMHANFLEGFMAVAEILRNQSDRFKNRALPGAVDLPQIPELVERGRMRLKAYFDKVDRHLADRRYVVADALTQADIDTYITCEFAGWVKESIPAACQNLQAWHDRIKGELGA